MKKDFEPGYYEVPWMGVIADFYQVDGKWWIGKGDDCWYIDHEFERYAEGAKFIRHFRTWPGCEERCNCNV